MKHLVYTAYEATGIVLLVARVQMFESQLVPLP